MGACGLDATATGGISAPAGRIMGGKITRGDLDLVRRERLPLFALTAAHFSAADMAVC
jgi:hypothetical protein